MSENYRNHLSKNKPKNRTDRDQHLARIGDRSIWIREPQQHPLLLAFWQRYGSDESCDDGAQVWLSAESGGIECQWYTGRDVVQLEIDVEKFCAKQKSYPTKRGGVLNQALGKRTQTIADLTGGWGVDAMLLSSQGYRVSVLERHPLMALLLTDSMQRMAQTPWVAAQAVCVPEVLHDDAGRWLAREGANGLEEFDTLYLDPMFPPKRKRSAAPNKQMQFLQWLLGPEEDAASLLERALASGVKRVVVKRPIYAEPLVSNPEQRFSGKLVNYDVYLNHG